MASQVLPTPPFPEAMATMRRRAGAGWERGAADAHERPEDRGGEHEAHREQGGHVEARPVGVLREDRHRPEAAGREQAEDDAAPVVVVMLHRRHNLGGALL